MIKAAVTAALFVTTAAPVLAADTQPYQQGVTLFAYEQGGDHFCPTGTQPIRYNGVICCGTPNAYGYGDAPVVHRKTYTPAMNMTNPKSPSYTPDRIPLGKSPNS